MHHRHHTHGRGPRMFFRGGMEGATGTGSCLSSHRSAAQKSGTCPRDRFSHELIKRLEKHQRDLEQQLADIADVLTHLRHRPESQPQPQV